MERCSCVFEAGEEELMPPKHERDRLVWFDTSGPGERGGHVLRESKIDFVWAGQKHRLLDHRVKEDSLVARGHLSRRPAPVYEIPYSRIKSLNILREE